MDSEADRQTVRALQEANGLTASLMADARQRAEQAEASARRGLLSRLTATLRNRAARMGADDDQQCKVA
jgi:hypothetical protein